MSVLGVVLMWCFTKVLVMTPTKIGSRLDKVLCSLLWVTLLWQGVGLGDPQRSPPTPTIL